MKLDINMKSRRINRPVQFYDQHSGVFSPVVLANIIYIPRQHTGWGEIRPGDAKSIHSLQPSIPGNTVYYCRIWKWGWILMNLVSVIKCNPWQVDTIRANLITRGMAHSEGGWPKVANIMSSVNPFHFLRISARLTMITQRGSGRRLRRMISTKRLYSDCVG